MSKSKELSLKVGHFYTLDDSKQPYMVIKYWIIPQKGYLLYIEAFSKEQYETYMKFNTIKSTNPFMTIGEAEGLERPEPKRFVFKTYRDALKKIKPYEEVGTV